MMFPLVGDLATDKAPGSVTCRVLGFSTRPTTTGWPTRSASVTGTTPTWSTPRSMSIMRTLEFGYRFITDELPDYGITASRNRVNRLCSQHQLWSVHSRKRGLSRRPDPAGPRRSGRPAIQNRTAQPAVVDRPD
jgi:hypothetical protein